MGIDGGKVIQKYNSLDKIWSPADKWHKRTYQTIQEFIDKHVANLPAAQGDILNAGSAGNPYGLPEQRMQHLDIAGDKIMHLPNATIGSIEKIPFDDNRFDLIVCVGSVLGYVDPMKAFEEFNRVLRKGGNIVIEFENSNTLELAFTRDYNRKAILVDTFYYGKEKLWYYSDQWIEEIISLNKLHIDRTYKFHFLSPFIYRFTKDENKAGPFFVFDPIFRALPFVRNIASNTIMLINKE